MENDFAEEVECGRREGTEKLIVTAKFEVVLITLSAVPPNFDIIFITSWF